MVDYQGNFGGGTKPVTPTSNPKYTNAQTQILRTVFLVTAMLVLTPALPVLVG
jgi:hypothetical protein